MNLPKVKRFDEEKSKKLFKIKKLEIGDKFYTSDGYLNHIVSFLNDGDTKLIVYKCWLNHRGYWGYYIKYFDSILFDLCLLNDIPKSKRKEFWELNGVDPTGWGLDKY